jgi:hypothetical protein
MDSETVDSQKTLLRTVLLTLGTILSTLGIGISVATWNPFAMIGTIIVAYLTMYNGRGSFTDTDFED